MRRAVSAASFFKPKDVVARPQKVIFLDMLCLLKRGYDKELPVTLYQPYIIEQIKNAFSDVPIYVFNIIANSAEIECWVRDELAKISVRFFSKTSIDEVVKYAGCQYLLHSEAICFVTSSRKNFDKIPDSYQKIPLLPSAGAYHLDDFELLMQVAITDQPHVLCFDIDDTVLFLQKTMFELAPVLNFEMINLVRTMNESIKIKEILFLTARPSELREDMLQPFASEDELHLLEEKNPIHVRVIAHYFNQCLTDEDIAVPQVNRVIYSNAGYSYIGNRKYVVLDELREQGVHPILIDNSKEEHHALARFKSYSANHQDLLSGIRVLEHAEADSKIIAAIRKSLSCSIFPSHQQNDDGADVDSAILLDKSVSFSP